MQRLNANKNVNGISRSAAPSKHVNAEKILNAIDADKDVDGFHPLNVGRLWIGERASSPARRRAPPSLQRRLHPR